MKIKTVLLIVLALSQWPGTSYAQKNYYQFGLGVWVFEPTTTQAYAMSYERKINKRFAIGSSFTWLSEEWTGSFDLPKDIPRHHFVYGERFSYQRFLPNHVEDAGLVNFQGHLIQYETTFFGLYLAYMPLIKERFSFDIALGGGVVAYNDRMINSESYCDIKIDSTTYFGVAQLPAYARGIGFAGFFRARVNYLVYGNLYAGGALLLDYDFYMGGFPLKCILNFGIKF